MKKFYFYLIVLSFLLGLSGCGKVSPEQVSNTMQHQLLLVSNLYTKSLYETVNLVDRSKDLDYIEFDSYMTDIMKDWERLEQEAIVLGKNANEVVSTYSEKVSLLPKAYAYYDKQTITEMFDQAPAGKKIKTLADNLGVSAKKAFSILKMSQSQLQAEARNTAGDKFEILENSAKAVKDICKVGLYVGGVTLAGPTVGVLGEASMVVGGEDLILEIGEDTANIYYGYNNDVTAVFSDIRTITKPATAIIGIANISQISGDPEEILDTFVFFGDQILGVVNDNEILGVNIDHSKGDIELIAMSKDDKDNYFVENNIDTNADFDVVLQDIIDDKQEDTQAKQTAKNITEVKTNNTTNNNLETKLDSNSQTILGEWELVDTQNVEKQWYQGDKRNLLFKNNGIVIIKTNDKLTNKDNITEMNYSFENGKGDINISVQEKSIHYARIWLKGKDLYLSQTSNASGKDNIYIFSKSE